MAIVFVTALLRLIGKKMFNSPVGRYTIDENLCTFALQSATVLPQVPPPADRLESYIIANNTTDAGMGKTVFVPLTDDLLYEYPEKILGPVIPFSQQARRAETEPTALSSTTPSLHTKTQYKAVDRSPVRRSKKEPAVGPTEWDATSG